jgi:hypothetical protein
MAAVAAFLEDKQLTEFERATVARCMSKPYAANEDALLRLAEPYYRGELEQLIEILEEPSLSHHLGAQEHYEVRMARERGLSPFGSPKMHHGFLIAACRRQRIALRSFESRRIERPKPTVHQTK